MKQLTCIECGHTAYSYDEVWYDTMIGPMCGNCVTPHDPAEENEMARNRAKMIREQNAIADFDYLKL